MQRCSHLRLCAVPKVTESTKRSTVISADEVGLGGMEAPLIAKDMLEAMCLEVRPLLTSQLPAEKVFNLLCRCWYCEGAAAYRRYHFRRTVVVCDCNHGLHEAELCGVGKCKDMSAAFNFIELLITESVRVCDTFDQS